DNYIARTDVGVDWLRWSDEVHAIMAEYWKTIDMVVMGRKTYDVARRSGEKGTYPGVKTYVCSRTLKPGSDGAIEVVPGAVECVRSLKSQPGKGICVLGGGEVANALFEAQLIDEVGFNIHPVLLGSGIPLFLPMRRQVDLELIDCKTLSTGCVMVSYRVK